MGKKKDKVIPKRIAGVKLPKQLRRTGEALLTAAQSPQGRMALMAGMSVLSSHGAQARRAAADEAPLGPGEARDAPIDPAKVVQTVSIVANEVLNKLFAGKR